MKIVTLENLNQFWEKAKEEMGNNYDYAENGDIDAIFEKKSIQDLSGNE